MFSVTGFGFGAWIVLSESLHSEVVDLAPFLFELRPNFQSFGAQIGQLHWLGIDLFQKLIRPGTSVF